jgi:hypothetical protein
LPVTESSNYVRAEIVGIEDHRAHHRLRLCRVSVRAGEAARKRTYLTHIQRRLKEHGEDRRFRLSRAQNVQPVRKRYRGFLEFRSPIGDTRGGFKTTDVAYSTKHMWIGFVRKQELSAVHEPRKVRVRHAQFMLMTDFCNKKGTTRL